MLRSLGFRKLLDTTFIMFCGGMLADGLVDGFIYPANSTFSLLIKTLGFIRIFLFGYLLFAAIKHSSLKRFILRSNTVLAILIAVIPLSYLVETLNDLSIGCGGVTGVLSNILLAINIDVLLFLRIGVNRNLLTMAKLIQMDNDKKKRKSNGNGRVVD